MAFIGPSTWSEILAAKHPICSVLIEAALSGERGSVMGMAHVWSNGVDAKVGDVDVFRHERALTISSPQLVLVAYQTSEDESEWWSVIHRNHTSS